MLLLNKVRELDLRTPPQAGRPAHLSAASGLVRAGDFLYVVADDENHLGVFPARGTEPGVLLQLCAEILPHSPAERKAAKPDFEALTLLPACSQYPFGALLALGSGSRRNRRTSFLIELGADGAVSSPPRIVDLSGIFAAVEAQLNGINIEGATVSGERLRLLQRGNKRKGRNAIIDFSLSQLLDALLTSDAVTDARVLAISWFDLGAVSDVPLSFSDCATLPDGSLIFTAIAEDTEDAYTDGCCRGAAIGIIDASGVLVFLQSLAHPLKIEGIEASLLSDVIQVWLVTDADDASIPAALYSVELSTKFK
ncbi:MAG: hypothetical protein H7Y02_05495 [Candidatus Obscuribacterales bacterium]|nr:hypothetical protein [Steroidobacteraceae bacterium]